MAAARKQISIVRITVALLSIATLVIVIGGTFVAGMLTGIARQQDRAFRRDLQSARWTSILTQFAELDAVDRFGVLDKVEGNAVDLYWPDGINAERSPCMRFRGGGYDSPLWGRSDDWRHATRCGRIETLVQAAHMTRMDLSEWLSDLDPEAAPGGDNWFGIYSGPYADMTATISRAHQRIEDGDLDGAEADARAVVSAGLHFLRGGIDISGMALTSIALGDALDHLRAIAGMRGDAELASELLAAGTQVATLRKDVWRLSESAMKAAAVDEQLHTVGRLALDPTAPLGLRLHSAVMIGYGGFAHVSEVAFGPSEARRQLLDEMAADPVLAVAVARAREPYRKKLSERFDIYTQALAAN
jgi:hypothetical protein